MLNFIKVVGEWDFEMWVRALLLICGHLAIYPFLSRGAPALEFAIYYGLAFFCLFGIAGSYHRYFAHKTFQLNRFWQFVFALQGLSSFQWGPLWWASYHRIHHATADREGDPHNPQTSVFHAYIGWFMRTDKVTPPKDVIPDLMKYPELVFLEKYSLWFSLSYFVIFYFVGEWLAINKPHLLIDGLILTQLYGLGIVHCFHACSFTNTYSHLKGTRRYETPDKSRNNWILFFTNPTGETWHNNHHYYAASAKIGYYWWELDPTYYIIKFLSYLRITKNIKLAPRELMEPQSSPRL